MATSEETNLFFAQQRANIEQGKQSAIAARQQLSQFQVAEQPTASQLLSRGRMEALQSRSIGLQREQYRTAQEANISSYEKGLSKAEQNLTAQQQEVSRIEGDQAEFERGRKLAFSNEPFKVATLTTAASQKGYKYGRSQDEWANAKIEYQKAIKNALSSESSAPTLDLGTPVTVSEFVTDFAHPFGAYQTRITGFEKDGVSTPLNKITDAQLKAAGYTKEGPSSKENITPTRVYGSQAEYIRSMKPITLPIFTPSIQHPFESSEYYVQKGINWLSSNIDTAFDKAGIPKEAKISIQLPLGFGLPSVLNIEPTSLYNQRMNIKTIPSNTAINNIQDIKTPNVISNDIISKAINNRNISPIKYFSMNKEVYSTDTTFGTIGSKAADIGSWFVPYVGTARGISFIGNVGERTIEPNPLTGKPSSLEYVGAILIGLGLGYKAYKQAEPFFGKLSSKYIPLKDTGIKYVESTTIPRSP